MIGLEKQKSKLCGPRDHAIIYYLLKVAYFLLYLNVHVKFVGAKKPLWDVQLSLKEVNPSPSVTVKPES